MSILLYICDMHAYVHVCLHVGMLMQVRGWLQVSSWLFFTLFTEVDSALEPGIQWFNESSYPACSRDSLPLKSARNTGGPPHLPTFYVGAGLPELLSSCLHGNSPNLIIYLVVLSAFSEKTGFSPLEWMILVSCEKWVGHRSMIYFWILSYVLWFCTSYMPLGYGCCSCVG